LFGCTFDDLTTVPSASPKLQKEGKLKRKGSFLQTCLEKLEKSEFETPD